ncbi:MAG: signal peptidase I [Micrococcales bacterium]|nr:signal peptidase I [Micrococcales bacterium]MCL2667196.1 signal peptidase I [Micrococcales bacterium]
MMFAHERPRHSRTSEPARTAAPGARVRARRDSPARIVAATVYGAFVLVVLGVVVALAVVPKATGGTALTVLTGSMQPTLRPGDVIVVRAVAPADVCSTIRPGDIVTFLPEPDDPSLITHRVVAKSVGSFDDGTTCRLVTQGDANSAVDEPISPNQVRGVFWYGLPKLGWAKQRLLESSTGVLVLGGLVALVWWLVPRRRPQVVAVSTPAAGLRERELQLREREVAVREAELAAALAGPPAQPPAGQT